MNWSEREMCQVFGHDWVFTDEYRNPRGHVQADKVCQRCGDCELGWTGPTAEAVEQATGVTVPSKEEAYAEVSR